MSAKEASCIKQPPVELIPQGAVGFLSEES